MHRILGFLSAGILMASARSPLVAKTNEVVVLMNNAERVNKSETQPIRV
jgi:hypothetical protein